MALLWQSKQKFTYFSCHHEGRRHECPDHRSHFKARSPSHGWLQFLICQRSFPTKRDNSFMQTHCPAKKEGFSTYQSSSLSLYFHVSIPTALSFPHTSAYFWTLTHKLFEAQKHPHPPHFLCCPYKLVIHSPVGLR